jgi:hypothetical protein
MEKNTDLGNIELVLFHMKVNFLKIKLMVKEALNT